MLYENLINKLLDLGIEEDINTGDVTTDDAVFTNNATSAEFTFSQSTVGVYNYNLSATELGNYYFLSSSFQR